MIERPIYYIDMKEGRDWNNVWQADNFEFANHIAEHLMETTDNPVRLTRKIEKW